MKFLAFIFALFCFFPYIDILGIGTDTQPNALLAGGLLLLLIKDKKITTPIVLLWILFFFSLFLIINNNLSFFEYLKNSFNYLSPALVATTSYILFKRNKLHISFRFFITTILAYLFFGLVQQFISPGFGSVLLNNMRGVMLNGRGVVSLCPEPAFYGSICLFFIAFSVIQFSKKQNLIILPILIAQLFFLSRSATAVAILALSLVLFTLVQMLRLKLKYIIYASLFLAISIPTYYAQLEKLESTRMGKIASDFIQDPIMVTQIDESVGVRFAGAAVPFLSFIHRGFMPMGLGNYKNFLRELYVRGKHRSFLNPVIINEKDKLGGSMNLVLFQLGLFGLLFPIAIFLSFKSKLHKDNYIYACILFCCLLFTQLQLMHSFIGFVLGYVMCRTRQTSDL